MKKIICGKENVDTFRAEMKAVAPDFYNLARELFASGMISGLRGATLEIGPISPLPVIEMEMEEKASTTCSQCGQWVRDSIGDGTGIGECLRHVRPDLVKWPGREACHKFEGLKAL